MYTVPNSRIENQPPDMGARGRAGWAGVRVRAGMGVSRRGQGRGRVLAGVRVGVRMGAWVSVRTGVWVCWCFFFWLKRCIFLAHTCLLFTVTFLSCIQTRFSRLRPRTRTRPTHYTIQPNTTTGWLFASGSSWTLGHTGGSRLWVHLCPKGKAVGGPQLVPRQTTARQKTSLETNVLSANRRQDKRSALHTMIGSLRSRMAIFLFF